MSFADWCNRKGPSEPAAGLDYGNLARSIGRSNTRKAIKGFQANGFLVLVNDRQLVDLDEEVVLRVDSRVSFLRLVALVGG